MVPRARKGFTSGTCTRHAAPPAPGNHKPVLTYSDGQDVEAAVAMAKAASVAIVVLAQTSHEGADRSSMYLGQSELASAVAGESGVSR